MTGDLFQEFEGDIKELTIVPSDGGRFEVSVDGKLIYSKLEEGRHPEEGEILKLFMDVVKE